MRVIATVGLPGSGKGEAAEVAADLHIPVVSMGDVVRAATRERGGDPATDHGRVAKALREEEGPDAIAARSLPRIRERFEAGADVVLVDGVRSDAEVACFEDAFGEDFSLVSIEAPFEVRRERIAERGRDATAAEGGEDLAERDERELGFGMGRAMEQADHTIENTESLAAFREAVADLLRAERRADP
ncbi:MAG: AAA family ATPase [Halobacteriaceae archaeon]